MSEARERTSHKCVSLCDDQATNLDARSQSRVPSISADTHTSRRTIPGTDAFTVTGAVILQPYPMQKRPGDTILDGIDISVVLPDTHSFQNVAILV